MVRGMDRHRLPGPQLHDASGHRVCCDSCLSLLAGELPVLSSPRQPAHQQQVTQSPGCAHPSASDACCRLYDLISLLSAHHECLLCR